MLIRAFSRKKATLINFRLRRSDGPLSMRPISEDDRDLLGTIHDMQGLAYAFQCHTLAYVPLLLTDAYPWYETGPLALRRSPETRNPEAGLPPTEGPAPGDRVTQDGQPGAFLPPPPQA